MASNGTVSSPNKSNEREQRRLARSASAVSPNAKKRKPRDSSLKTPSLNFSNKAQKPAGDDILDPVAAKLEKNPFVAQDSFIGISSVPVDDAPASKHTGNVRAPPADSEINALLVANSDGTFSCAICKDMDFAKKAIAMMHQKIWHSTSADTAFRRGKVGKRAVNTFDNLERQPFLICDAIVSPILSHSFFF